MLGTFSASDLAALWAAFGLVGVMLVVPGYVAGGLLNPLQFRTRTLPFQIAAAICLSVSLEPVALYLCWRFLPHGVWVELVFVCALLPVAVMRSRAAWQQKVPGATKIVAAAIVAWLAVGSFCLIDLQLGHRLYVALVSYDYALRAAFTSAIVRTGVPPVNPYFFPGQAYTLRYHYFWYMVAAVASRATGGAITPRIAVMAATLWSGVGLVSLVSVCVAMAEDGVVRTRRVLMVALGLLLVSGLDIVPTAAIFAFAHRLNASTEWWNEPVLSWVNSVFWQPHSVAALIACVTGTLILRSGGHEAPRGTWMRNGIVCGVAVASAIGLSIYVALVFAVVLPIWALICWRKQWTALRSSALVAMGTLLVCAMPYGLELLHGPDAPNGPPAVLTIRSFYFAEALTNGTGQPHGRWVVPLTNLAFLPLNYLLEFGVFLIVVGVQWKRLRGKESLSGDDVFEVVLLCTSLVLCTFFRSQTIANNDLGWRTVLPAQWVLLLWGARLWDDGLFPAGARWKSAPGVMVLLGVTATVYDVAMVRAYPLLLDHTAMPRYGWLAPDQKEGERFYALRQTYEALDRELPKQARVQQNPMAVPQDLYFGLYGDGQTAMETEACGAVFGGDAKLCPALRSRVMTLFAEPNLVRADEVDGVCEGLGIGAVVVKDTDAAWNAPDSWVWQKAPMFANSYARAFRCGSQ